MLDNLLWPLKMRRASSRRHFIIIRGDALAGVVGAGGDMENVSHAL
jgi:hypothetical protein